MANIEVRCPTCSKMGKIEIDETAIKSISRGLLAVTIAKSTICSHSFIAYVDKNLNIRDYFLPDFQIEIPKPMSIDSAETKRIPGIDIIDLDLIKINLSPALLTYCLRGIFLKKKIILITEQKYLYSHISNFFKYITQNSFKFDLSIISPDEYEKTKDSYKEFLVFKGKEIINNPKDVINPKKLYLYTKIIDQFLSESQSTLSLVLLKNEVKKSYELSKSIFEFANNYRKREKLSSKIITDYLIDAHGMKIQKDYEKFLDFLLEIADEYFKVKIIDSSNVADFLDFI